MITKNVNVPITSYALEHRLLLDDDVAYCSQVKLCLRTSALHFLLPREGLQAKTNVRTCVLRNVVIAMEALDQLLMACHSQSIKPFVESFLHMVAKLLESKEPDLQVLGTNSVRPLCLYCMLERNLDQ